MVEAEFERLSMHGKVALVTGGAKGMGAAHSRLIAARGGSVIIGDVDDAGEALADEIRSSGAEARFVRLEVTSEEQWREVIDEAISRHGRIDALVNNAGVATVKPIIEATLEDVDFVFGVNFRGAFLGCRSVLPAMKERGGPIVNIASASAMKAIMPTLSLYSASKAAVRMFSKVAAWEFTEHHIRVNTVHPGLVETTLNREYLKDPATRRMMMGSTMYDRAEMPDEVAEMVLFLRSNASSYITGADFAVDGGWSAN